jgi:hypothetical protein
VALTNMFTAAIGEGRGVWWRRVGPRRWSRRVGEARLRPGWGRTEEQPGRGAPEEPCLGSGRGVDGQLEGGGGVGAPGVVADKGVLVADRAPDGCGQDMRRRHRFDDCVDPKTRCRPDGGVNPETPERCSSATVTRRRGS